MGTKNKPGDYDCYAHADPDEPMFVLLGRDPMAGALVQVWAQWRRQSGEDHAKVTEAERCARAMDAWARGLGKSVRRIEALALDADPNEKKPRIKVRPIGHAPWCICDTWADVGQMIEGDGEYEFEHVGMTDAEVEALGEFPGW